MRKPSHSCEFSSSLLRIKGQKRSNSRKWGYNTQFYTLYKILRNDGANHFTRLSTLSHRRKKSTRERDIFFFYFFARGMLLKQEVFFRIYIYTACACTKIRRMNPRIFLLRWLGYDFYFSVGKREREKECYCNCR